jgi:hypothetical protein
MAQYVNIIRQITKKSLLPIAISIVIIFSNACGNTSVENLELRKWYATKTDSLWIQLAETRKNFNFRMDEIAERKEEMESQLKILAQVNGTDLSSEEKSEIVNYNSVFQVYKPLANKYKETVMETEDVFYRIKALDQSVKKGAYDDKKEEFKKNYSELASELNHVLNESKELAETLTSVEPMFQRLAPKIDDLVLKFQAE